MKYIFLLLSFSLYGCISFNETFVIYEEDDYGPIYSENGIVELDTIMVILDDYIPSLSASTATIDFGERSPIIVNSYGSPILFTDNESLFKYMNVRNYEQSGFYKFTINNKIQGAWIFTK